MRDLKWLKSAQSLTRSPLLGEKLSLEMSEYSTGNSTFGLMYQ